MQRFIRHWRLWVPVGLLVALLLAVASWLARSNYTISQATLDRIRVGMTYEEVEAVVGAPAESGLLPTRDSGAVAMWDPPRGPSLIVKFDPQCRVRRAAFGEVWFPEPVWKRLKRTLIACIPDFLA